MLGFFLLSVFLTPERKSSRFATNFSMKNRRLVLRLDTSKLDLQDTVSTDDLQLELLNQTS